MHAFRRDLELMELIAATDAVLKARVDPEDVRTGWHTPSHRLPSRAAPFLLIPLLRRPIRPVR